VDWTRARAINLQPEILFSAVSGKVAFLCVASTELLLHAIEHETTEQGFRKILRTGSGYALSITADLASQLWCSEAAGLIIERLEQNLTDDCAPLIEKLGGLISDDSVRQRIESIFRDAIQYRSVPLIDAILHAVEELGLDSHLEKEIREAFEYWLNEGPQGPVESGVVPPNAVGPLLKYLAARRLLTFDDLRRALVVSMQRHRSEVKAMVLPELARLLSNDVPLMRKSLMEIGDGRLPPELLYELSKSHPLVCQDHADDLLKLLESDTAGVRTACVRVVGDGVIDPHRVKPILRALIQSDDHNIRDEAVAALRRLQTSRVSK
jgi:HEAT repeat protein